MSTGDSNEYPETWPPWVVKAARDLEATEKPLMYFAPVEAPAWVATVAGELIRVMNPTLTIEHYQRSGPRFLGELVGHQEALITGDEGIVRRLEKAAEIMEALDKLLQAKLSKKAYDRIVEEGKKYEGDIDRFCAGFEDVLTAKAECIKAVVNVANRQRLNEKIDFFGGYAHALATPLFNESGRLAHEKLTTNIYLLMCIFWKYVRKMPSTAVLHGWLTRLLGNQAVGDLDRVRKICFRIKLRLRPRGRPRKMGH